MKISFSLYCTCGASWKGTVEGKAFKLFSDNWAKSHTGPEHRACDAKTAAAARRKLDCGPNDGTPRITSMRVG